MYFIHSLIQSITHQSTYSALSPKPSISALSIHIFLNLLYQLYKAAKVSEYKDEAVVEGLATRATTNRTRLPSSRRKRNLILGNSHDKFRSCIVIFKTNFK